MLKHLVERKLSAFEREWDYSLDYAREILGLGVLVLKKFNDAQAIGDYCEGIHKSAGHAAKILGVMDGDCGPCVQLTVDMALKDGVSPESLQALVAGEFDALPSEMHLVARFTRALVARTDALPELREQMRSAYGTEGLVSVAYAVINASMFPILKYALGHGHTCSKINVGESQVVAVSPVRRAARAEVA